MNTSAAIAHEIPSTCDEFARARDALVDLLAQLMNLDPSAVAEQGARDAAREAVGEPLKRLVDESVERIYESGVMIYLSGRKLPEDSAVLQDGCLEARKELRDVRCALDRDDLGLVDTLCSYAYASESIRRWLGEIDETLQKVDTSGWTRDTRVAPPALPPRKPDGPVPLSSPPGAMSHEYRVSRRSQVERVSVPSAPREDQGHVVFAEFRPAAEDWAGRLDLVGDVDHEVPYETVEFRPLIDREA